MAQGQFQPIYPNPYIVGNPIRNREMFFGRVDEFNYIARELDNGQRTALIVLFGERRSGKSSILYQILNGQLGPAFLPIFVDMQLMAGIATEAEFFGRLIAEAGKTLGKEGLEITSTILRPDAANPAEKFHQFLRLLKERFPEKAPLLLIDEYEILENKITEGCLSRHVLTFFGGLLESEQVSFVFTGSKKLGLHNPELWDNSLMRRAVSRKISFLTRDDTTRLVTLPLANQVRFTPEVLEQIYGLTAGQPFYTQLICQNLVYHLNEIKKYFVEGKDLETVVSGILENPPPQLIFNWGEHAAEHKLALALLAEFSPKPGRYLSTANLRHRIKQSKLDIVLSDAKLKTWLTDLGHDEYLLQDDYRFAFRLDLFRRWIRHDHNIWQVKKEIGAEELERICEREREKKEQKKKIIIVLERVALAVVGVAAIYLLIQFYNALQKGVKVTANGGPFLVEVDGKMLATTRGQKDSTVFIYKENLAGLFSRKKLTKGFSYEFAATLLAANETRRDTVEIIEDNQVVPFRFSEDTLTVITDAESLLVKLGELKVHTRGKPEAWKHTFAVCAGKYILETRPLPNGKSRIDTVAIKRAKPDTVKIDFPELAVITLTANFPFRCRYGWIDEQGGKRDGLLLQAAESLRVTKRGNPTGLYQFTFINDQTGEEKALTKYRLTTDTTIVVAFNANYKKPGPFERTDDSTGKKKSVKHLLVIISDPPGAQIFLDNVPRGMTNNAVELTEGRHVIELNKAGYEPAKQEINLTKADTVKIKLDVQFGYLKVIVMDAQGNKPTEVNVYGQKADWESEMPWGRARQLERIVKKLPAGNYKIRAESDEYFGEKRITVNKNDTATVIVNLSTK